jgi:hypothetical protein
MASNRRGAEAKDHLEGVSSTALGLRIEMATGEQFFNWN